MGYNYFSNVGKGFVNNRGSIEVYYVNKNIYELINSIDKLYIENSELKGDTKKDSIITFVIFISLNDSIREITYRAIGGGEYKEMYQNMNNQPSSLEVESNQSINQ